MVGGEGKREKEMERGEERGEWEKEKRRERGGKVKIESHYITY